MAQRVEVLLVDDLDGSTADESVSFGLDGVQYEIDLSTENAAKLRSALEGYVNSARRVRKQGQGQGRRLTAASVGNTPESLAKIREWARENGHKVSDRGRIAGPVVAAFKAAHA